MSGGTINPSAASPVGAAPRPPKRRLLRPMLLGLAVLLVAALIVQAVRLWPWVAMPDEGASAIQERFRQVERLVPPASAPPGDDAALVKAAILAKPLDVGRMKDDKVPLLATEAISDEGREALALLETWHASGKGLALPRCASEPEPEPLAAERGRGGITGYVKLGRLALRSTRGAEDLPRVEAVLRLAQALRTGTGMVTFALGLGLAREAAAWSSSRGAPLPASFEAYRPRAEDVVGAFALEATCMVRLVDAMENGIVIHRQNSKFGSASQPHPPFGLVRMPREKLVVKKFFADFVLEVEPRRADLPRVAEAYQRAFDAMPPSLTLRSVVLMPAFFTSAAEDVAAYERLAPPRAPTTTPPGSPARGTPDYAVSIPGVLTIRAPDRISRTHGVGDEPWRASFLVTNETAQPLSVRVSDLTLRSDAAGISPADRAQPMRVSGARAGGVAASIQNGEITFEAPPRKEIELTLDGDSRQDLHISYHVVYRHEAAFHAGKAPVIGRGYAMNFRHPHKIPP